MDEGGGEDFIPQRAINPVIPKDEVEVVRDALSVELSDEDFLEFAKRQRREEDEWWNGKAESGYNLRKRQDDNERMLFGRQYLGIKKKRYESTAQDNIILEAEDYLHAMAFSKLPDITVTPGSDTPEKKQIAKMLSKVLTPDRKSREFRHRKRVLGMAFKHMPVYYFGAVKRFWNPQKGKFGDMDAKFVHPQNLTLDHRSVTNDVSDMDFLYETVEETVKEILMKFPKSEKKFIEELYKYNIFRNGTDDAGNPYPNENNSAGMNTKVKYVEVWFKEYKKHKDKETEWEEVPGIAWYFNGCLFDKMRHPYWDWTGEPQTFSYEIKEIEGKQTRVRQPATTDQLKQLLTGQTDEDTETETIFHNHLDYPEFPYIFLGFHQWGKSPVDETTRIEQGATLQNQYDKRSRQIDEILDRSRPKMVFSSSEGYTKDDVANIDPADPYQKVLLRGKLNESFLMMPGEQPQPQLFTNLLDERERIFDKAGVHQATRGQANQDTPATNTQLSREGDFSRLDDLMDDTINYASERWANWDMQFIKLFYTEAHLKRVIGPDGQWLNVMIHRDDVSDGMEVIISASGSDKLRAEQAATDDAKMKLTHPFQYYTDKGYSDPRGRTLGLMNFLMNPQGYLMDIQNGGDGTQIQNGVQGAADVVNGQQPQGQQPGQLPQPESPQSPPGQSGGDPQAIQDIMQIQEGQVPPPPQQVSPEYMQTFSQFMQSPVVEQLIQKFGEQFKQQLLTFAQTVAQLSKQTQQQPQAQGMQGIHPAAAMGGQTNGSVGPLTGNPGPGNTSRIAAVPPRSQI